MVGYTIGPWGRERARRLITWVLIIAVLWMPGVVALVMLLTGHAGR